MHLPGSLWPLVRINGIHMCIFYMLAMFLLPLAHTAPSHLVGCVSCWVVWWLFLVSPSLLFLRLAVTGGVVSWMFFSLDFPFLWLLHAFLFWTPFCAFPWPFPFGSGLEFSSVSCCLVLLFEVDAFFQPLRWLQIPLRGLFSAVPNCIGLCGCITAFSLAVGGLHSIIWWGAVSDRRGIFHDPFGFSAPLLFQFVWVHSLWNPCYTGIIFAVGCVLRFSLDVLVLPCGCPSWSWGLV